MHNDDENEPHVPPLALLLQTGYVRLRNGKGTPMDVKDSNGNVLKDGDSVTVIKDLKVKGAGETLKRGTTIKNIRLTDNPGEIEGRTGSIKGLVLKTEFVKKA